MDAENMFVVTFVCGNHKSPLTQLKCDFKVGLIRKRTCWSHQYQVEVEHKLNVLKGHLMVLFLDVKSVHKIFNKI